MFGIIKKFFWGVLILLICLGLIFFWPKQKQNPLPATEETLKILTIEPTEKHSATVIFLHGLGDNAEVWENNFRPIAKNYPHIKFIIPQALTIPVSMNWGWQMPAWYNIKGNIKNMMNLKEDKQGLLNSVSQIKKIIQEEINSGIKPEKIIVGGFSQGGATALAVGLTVDYSLGGIISLSGFLPCRDEIFSLAKEKQTPFHFYHNYYDDLVPFELGKKSAELIENQGFMVKFNEKNVSTNHFWPREEIRKISNHEFEELLK